MPKPKKPKSIAIKSKPRPRLDPDVARRLRTIASHVALVVVVIAGAGVGLHFARQYTDRQIVFYGKPPRVILKNRPVWMSDYLADQVVSAVQPVGAHSTFDRQLLVDIGDALKGNPWIKNVVAVRRAFAQHPGDTVEVDCVYRVPLALVHWKDYFWLVDSEGVKLPEQFTANQLPRVMHGRDGKIQFRIIEGVRSVPVESGYQWLGDDLSAGLELAKYLYGQPYAEEVQRIDVGNFAGRSDAKEAQLILLTDRGTEVRWGRPIGAKDFFVEVSVAQKLSYMSRVFAKYGRVDANQPWIDIRFDKVTYPSGAEQQARADSGTITQ